MKSLAVAGLLFVSSAFGASALFPTPLHIVRRIDDPLAKAPITIDEYCYGNRIVTINGPRVAISDFAEQTLTEIDHGSLTYSVTRFDQIAAAQLPKTSAESNTTNRHIAVDRSVGLSREAIEALIGVSYPNTRTAEHDEVMHAAANPRNGRIAATSASVETYGIPTEETVTYDNGLTFRNVVVHFNTDLPPAASIVIDPGATRVESRLTRLRRELEQLDKLPSPHP